MENFRGHHARFNGLTGYELTPIYDDLLLSCDHLADGHMTSDACESLQSKRISQFLNQCNYNPASEVSMYLSVACVR